MRVRVLILRGWPVDDRLLCAQGTSLSLGYAPGCLRHRRGLNTKKVVVRFGDQGSVAGTTARIEGADTWVYAVETYLIREFVRPHRQARLDEEYFRLKEGE
jgi:hypothetical protein